MNSCVRPTSGAVLTGLGEKASYLAQDFRIYSRGEACYARAMKKISAVLLMTTTLALSACGQAGQQWWDPDKSFALFDQPEVKGVNATQEEMAKEAMIAGDYNRAQQFYQQLVSSQKGTPEEVLRYKMGMAEATRRLGDNANALAMFEELHRQFPANVEVAEGRGLSMMGMGKTVEAGRAFSEVMEKDPKRWRTLNALGILFVSKNMIPEAIAYYTEALSFSPDNAAVLNNVGLSYGVDRQFARGIEVLQQAARVSKTPLQRKHIEMNLAMIYGVSGDMEQAREVASKYIEGPALDNNLGLYAHLSRDDNLAKTYLNMALSQSPTYYDRAWENLNLVNDAARSDLTPAPKPKAAVTLPKTDKLEEPTPVAKPEKVRSSKGKKKKPASEPAPEPVSNEAAPADEMPKAIMIPEVKAQGESTPAATGEKPSGLVIGPSEGD